MREQDEEQERWPSRWASENLSKSLQIQDDLDWKIAIFLILQLWKSGNRNARAKKAYQIITQSGITTFQKVQIQVQMIKSGPFCHTNDFKAASDLKTHAGPRPPQSVAPGLHKVLINKRVEAPRAAGADQ